MKKIKSFPLYILLLTLSSIFVVSCSEDNPVIQTPEEPYQFDSARYDWSVEIVNQDLLTFQAFDTSNIIFLGARNLTYYNGKKFNAHYFGFDGLYALSIDCFDQKNIYIGGDDNSVSSENGKPRLKKWNGSSFNEIPIKDSTNRRYQISAIQAKGENEIWMGSTRGDLIHYNNGSFEFLRIDSTFIFSDFGKDENGYDYCVAIKTIFDTSATTRYLNIYKKTENQWKWDIVFSQTYSNYDFTEIIPTKIDNNLFGFRNNNILKFTGNNFNKIFEIKPFVPYQINQFSDNTINSFMLPGGNDNSGLKLFNWNGSKWSLEISFGKMNIYGDVFAKISNISDKYYFLYLDYILGITYFGKGKLKAVSK